MVAQRHRRAALWAGLVAAVIGSTLLSVQWVATCGELESPVVLTTLLGNLGLLQIEVPHTATFEPFRLGDGHHEYRDDSGFALSRPRRDGAGIGTTAYCIYGVSKGIDRFGSEWMENHKKNVLDVLDADVFVVSPEHKSAEAKRLNSWAVSSWTYTDPDMLRGNATRFFTSRNPTYREQLLAAHIDGNALGCLFRGEKEMAHWGHGHCQILDIYQCYEMVRRYEEHYGNGSRYEYVGFARPDLFFPSPHIGLDVFRQLPEVGCWLGGPGLDFGGICDHYGFCRRDAASRFGRGYVDRIVPKPDRILKFYPPDPDSLHLEKVLDAWLKDSEVVVGRLPWWTMFRSYRTGKGDVELRTEKRKPPSVYLKFSDFRTMSISGYRIRGRDWIPFYEFSYNHSGSVFYTPAELKEWNAEWFAKQVDEFQST